MDEREQRYVAVRNDRVKEVVAQRHQGLQKRVISLMRYGIKARGPGFLQEALNPREKLIERVRARLVEKGFAQEATTERIVDALAEAHGVLSHPPKRRLIEYRPCSTCGATDGAQCFEGISRSPHLARVVVACAELCQPPPRLDRAQVREVACPRCRAEAGEPCMGTRSPRIQNHQERGQAADAWVRKEIEEQS